MSLYQPIRTGLATQWIERVSSNPRFQFAAKVWQKLSNGAGASEEDIQAVRAGFDVLRDDRLGAVLLQFPFSPCTVLRALGSFLGIRALEINGCRVAAANHHADALSRSCFVSS